MTDEARDPFGSRRWWPARAAAIVQVVLLVAVVTFCVVILTMARADPARDATGLVGALMAVALVLLVVPTLLAVVTLALVVLRRDGGLVLMILYALVATLTAVLIALALAAGTGSAGDLIAAIAFPVGWGLLALASGVVALLTLRIVRRDPEPPPSTGIAKYRGARARRRRPL